MDRKELRYAISHAIVTFFTCTGIGAMCGLTISMLISFVFWEINLPMILGLTRFLTVAGFAVYSVYMIDGKGFRNTLKSRRESFQKDA